MTNSTSLHEQIEKLSAGTLDRHRAIASIMEELEAVDWYSQRVDAAENEELRQILAHNRDEEMEHAAMVIEWLRRNDAAFDLHLRTYLFSDRPILQVEENDTDSGGGSADAERPLAIGSLRTETA